jgi:hypothetical protein
MTNSNIDMSTSNPFNSGAGNENVNAGAKQEKMNVHRQLFENKMRENEG